MFADLLKAAFPMDNFTKFKPIGLKLYVHVKGFLLMSLMDEKFFKIGHRKVQVWETGV